jgi:predicted MFS family arabinose efflux permease
MIAGMITFVIAIGASGLAPTYEFLLAARFINGVGAAIFVPTAYAYVADRAQAETRAKAMSTLMTSFPAAALLGLPIGGFITSACGWRGVFGFIGLVALLALLILWTLPEDPRPGTQVIGYREGLRRVLGDPKVLKVIAVTFLWATAAMGSVTYIGQFFHEKYSLTSDQIGLVLMVIGVVGIVATRLGGQFINQIGTRRSVLFGIAAFGIAILILPWTPVMLVSILVFGFWAFGTWFGFPAQQTIVSELASGMRGTVLSFNTSAQYLGGVVGPVISGAVLEAGSFPLFGVWGTFLASCAFVLALRSLPYHPKKLAEQ